MRAFFGPQNWRLGGPPGGGERSWLESWLDMTTWWVEPATRASAQVLSYGPERILVELVDGVALRFGGERIECSVRGRSVAAHLDWLRLVPRKDRYEAHLQLSNVDSDGFAFDHLSAVAQSLEVDPGRHSRVTLSDIEVKGRSALTPVVAWLGSRLTDWILTVDQTGAVIARHRVRGVTLVVEPTVDHDAFQLELRAVRWRGHRLQVPNWLRLKRTVATLQLEPGVTVIEARRRGQAIDFDLRVESIQQGFELAQLREAILHGARIPLP